MQLGMIGLGVMGRPIAHNLHRPGEALTVVARTLAPLAEFEAKGVATSLDPKALADADLLFVCVSDGAAVKQILFGDDQLAAALKPGALVIDLSTVIYQEALEIAERLAGLGVDFLDAPISGLEKRAVEGTLTVMCGGAPASFERARPYLERIGSKILHMGATGAGQLMKMTNQLLYDVNMAALAEVMPMAVKMGLDPVQAAAVVNSGTGRSHASEYFLPQILEGVFDVSYPMERAYKDLVGAAKLGADEQIPLPVVAAMTATYQTALRQGHGAKDKGGMILVFEDLLGVKVRKPGF